LALNIDLSNKWASGKKKGLSGKPYVTPPCQNSKPKPKLYLQRSSEIGATIPFQKMQRRGPLAFHFPSLVFFPFLFFFFFGGTGVSLPCLVYVEDRRVLLIDTGFSKTELSPTVAVVPDVGAILAHELSL
jgi:hypothetical protein